MTVILICIFLYKNESRFSQIKNQKSETVCVIIKLMFLHFFSSYLETLMGEPPTILVPLTGDLLSCT
jgi:hypothetical protein